MPTIKSTERKLSQKIILWFDKYITQKELVLLFALILLFLLYILSIPSNHTEAEDAFDYALQVQEPNFQHYNARHLLYIPFSRLTFSVAKTFGLTSSYQWLVSLSIISSILTVLIFYLILTVRLGLPSFTAVISCAFLAFSYGFWRYSVEVEIYSVAGLLLVFLLYLALGQRQTPLGLCLMGVIGALSVLFHFINVIPAWIALLLVFTNTKKYSYSVVYGSVMTTIVLLAYYSFYGASLFDYTSDNGKFFYEGTLFSSFIKAAIGFGQVVYSGNFLFGYESFRMEIARLFPYRMFQEEIFMGLNAPSWSKVIPIITIWGCGFGWSYFLFRISKEPTQTTQHNKTVKRIFSFYIFLYAVIAIAYEPSNPEVWILFLIPFWILCTLTVFTHISSANSRLLVAILSLTILHNFFGGYLFISKSEGDYNLQKAAWYIQNTNSDDYIVTLDNEVFSRFLRYHSSATVINLYNASDAELYRVEQILNSGKPVYVVADVLYPPSYVKYLEPNFWDRCARWTGSRSLNLIKIRDDNFGGTYANKTAAFFWHQNHSPRVPSID